MKNKINEANENELWLIYCSQCETYELSYITNKSIDSWGCPNYDAMCIDSGNNKEVEELFYGTEVEDTFIFIKRVEECYIN